MLNFTILGCTRKIEGQKCKMHIRKNAGVYVPFGYLDAGMVGELKDVEPAKDRREPRVQAASGPRPSESRQGVHRLAEPHPHLPASPFSHLRLLAHGRLHFTSILHVKWEAKCKGPIPFT